MKKPVKGNRNKFQDYWKNLMSDSREEKMSRGSYNLSKTISWARGDNWRRNAQQNIKKFMHNNKKK